MVNRCAVFGCGSTADTAHGISTYSFPKNRAIRRTWVKFVKTTRTNFMDPKPDGTSATVCSKHFSEDCFEVPPSDKPLERSFQKKCRRLKKDAVPTIPSKKPLLLLKELYPYIRCALCTGFLIDATTITECLHTFCKSCIVKHFFCSNKCPTCSIVVHQTQPLYNVRPDRQLQDIVYQTVPHLEEAEKERMCAFYKERELPIPIKATPSVFSVQLLKQKQKDPILQSVFTIPPELDVSVMLDFVGAEEGIENYKPLERKYIRVSGEATIRHVELFIRRKMELTPNLKVDVVCGEHLLEQCQSLNEVQTTMGKNALQDGMLVLQYGLVLPPQ